MLEPRLEGQMKPKHDNVTILRHLVVLLGILTISLSSTTTMAQSTAAAPAWIDKAAKILRYGEGVASRSEMATFQGLSESQVIDRLMASPRFGLMVLDFNLYYFGTKVDELVPASPPSQTQIGARTNHFGFAAAAAQNPGALTSAWQTVNGGNYFSLFDHAFSDSWALRQPPNRDPSAYRNYFLQGWDFKFPLSYDDQQLTNSIVDFILAKLTQGPADILASNQPIDRTCLHATFPILAAMDLLGLSAADREVLKARPNKFRMNCRFPPEDYPPDPFNPRKHDHPNKAALAQDFRAFATYLRPIVTAIKSWPIKAQGSEHDYFAQVWRQPPPALSALRSKAQPFFGEAFFRDYPNSSTNFNRKRGAYVLKTFFCDDLIPVGLAAPAAADNHPGNLHASDPGCRSCHFKLDPMAGFFRHHGRLGQDFSNRDTFIFDDGKVITGSTLSHYWQSWLAPQATGRQLNIGYINSDTQARYNTYGESLEDLVTIIRTAPEAQRCLARKLARYIINDEQTFDDGWMASITATLTKPEPTTATFKNAIKAIITSTAFRQQNPNTDACYDFDPEATIHADRPPCQVAEILADHCQMCHQEGGAASGLALDTWQEVVDGSFGFQHLFTEDGVVSQRNPCETMSRLIDRLSTDDPSRRMPMMMAMPANKRATLFLWAQTALKQCHSGGQ